MTRPIAANEYILRINLRSGENTRRFCEVHVKAGNVYVFQPRKGNQAVKSSYHASGRTHLKMAKGPAMFVEHNARPEWIQQEEQVWSQSFENFAKLLPYKSEPADDICEIDLPESSADVLSFAQVSIGRFFNPKKWEHLDVRMTTLQQDIFSVSKSPSELRICVRLLQLESSASIMREDDARG